MKAFALIPLILVASLALGAVDVVVPTRIESSDYPALGYQARISGTVVLRAKLAGNGSPTDIQVIAGQKVLADAARENLSKWRFGSVSGVDDSGLYVNVTYEFRLGGLTSARPRSTFVYEYPLRVIISSEVPRWEPNDPAAVVRGK